MPETQQSLRTPKTNKSRTGLVIDRSGRRIRFEAGAVSWMEAAGGDAADPDAPKVPTFSATAYTGGTMQVGAFYNPVVIDLAGLGLRGDSIPALKDHDPSQCVGHAGQDGVTIAAQSIKVAGLVSGAGPAADEVRASSANGFPWKISVGCSLSKVEYVAEGATAKANGKTFKGPVNIIRGGTLEEISFVSIAADAKTSVKVSAAQRQRSHAMEKFAQWVQAEFGLDVDALSEDQTAKLQAKYDAAQTVPNTAPPAVPLVAGGEPDPVAAMRERVSADTLRIGQIQAECAGEFPEVQAKAIKEGWDLPRLQAQLKCDRELRDLRAGRPHAPAIHSEDGSQTSAKTIEAALCLSAGINPTFVGKQYDEKTMNAAMDRSMRNVTIHYVMDEAIRAAGAYYSGSRKSDDFIRAALVAERKIALQASFSTISLSGILSSVANKAMLAAYEAQETVWQYICAMRSHSDFKAVTQYRLDAQGAFKKVGPDGELKHIGLSEGSYSNQLDTFGTIIGLTRQMMYNDDLSAFLQIPTILGRLCATKIEEEVFKLLLSNPGNFFHANNRNLLTGAGSALSIDALNSAEAKFMNQIDSNKKPILVSPSILLVPTTLKVTADTLFAEKLLIDGTATAKQPARNPHAGKYQPYTSPFLNNTAIKDSDGAAIPNQSDNAWFLFANPAVRAAIALATLNGRMVPVIESSDAEFQTLGMQWRAYHDFGVGMEDPVGALKSNGQ